MGHKAKSRVCVAQIIRGAIPTRQEAKVVFDDFDGDEAQVHLEWLTRPYNIFEPEQVEMCRQAFSNLMAEAVTGEEARPLIERALESLR